MNASRIGLVCLLAAGAVTHAQQTTPTVPAAPAAPATAGSSLAAPATQPATATSVATGPTADGKYVIKDGDDVQLKFAQDISSKTATDGDPVELVLAEDLKVGGVVVARAGCKAVGEVTNAKKAGMMGKAGELNIRLDYLRVGDTKVHIRGTKGKEGASGTGAAVALTVLFGPIGLIKHGHDIDIKTGSPLHAFISDDTPLPPAV